MSIFALADKRRNVFLKNLLIDKFIGSMIVSKVKYFRSRSQPTLKKKLVFITKTIISDLVIEIKLLDFF